VILEFLVHRPKLKLKPYLCKFLIFFLKFPIDSLKIIGYLIVFPVVHLHKLLKFTLFYIVLKLIHNADVKLLDLHVGLFFPRQSFNHMVYLFELRLTLSLQLMKLILMDQELEIFFQLVHTEHLCTLEYLVLQLICPAIIALLIYFH
jgi:hypothetical protein